MRINMVKKKKENLTRNIKVDLIATFVELILHIKNKPLGTPEVSDELIHFITWDILIISESKK